MKASLNWLKEMVDIEGISIEELDKLITYNIIEIEEIKKLVDATNLCVGHVLECNMHPDSDHLHVCKIDLGDKVEQIVCGAPNMKTGINVIVSRVGAVLPGGFKIKQSKIRGVESNGMCCSLQELGFDEKYIPEEFKDGIYILDANAKAGDDPLKYLGLDDVCFDLNLTPNRADLLSILGISYDLAAVLNKKVKYNVKVPNEIDKNNPMQVSVLTDICKTYTCRYIENIKIKESPWWLKEKLITCGIRPINNVVDITNYVMLELGQPLHAFDAEKLGNRIIVRTAYNNEKMHTLDGQERILSEDDCVITDGEKIVAIAGVMGGLDTSVTKNTVNICLESAYFDSLAIRRTSSKLNLRSDSSIRYERKIDPARVELALNKAANLLEELADGKVLKGIVKEKSMDISSKHICISSDKINSFLGTSLSHDEIESIFIRLGFVVDNKDNIFNVYVPTRRVDIDNYQDLIEEVARIYGYNNISSNLPKTNDVGKLSEKQNRIREIHSIMEGLGNKEIVSYTLLAKERVDEFNNRLGCDIDLQMPMTNERSTVRQSLLNGIIDTIAYNKARQFQDISIYEISRVYYNNDMEKTLLSGGLTGRHSKSIWQGKNDKVDFYLLKGMLEVLFTKMGVEVSFMPVTNCPKGFHPKRTADINAVINGKQIKIGVAGNIHPLMQKKYDLDDTLLYEIELDDILGIVKKDKVFVSIPKYPSITRDIALIVDEKITAKELIDLIKQTGKKTLISAKVFDVYAGANVGINKKSIAISLVFQDNTKTLETVDIDKKVKSIVDRLKMVYNATLRS